jgi:hypothetical protein
MSFLHINCRSLLGNFDKFRVLTTNLSNSFSVIGLSETWLNDNTHDLVNLPGYDFISNHRQNKVGGGVGLYIPCEQSPLVFLLGTARRSERDSAQCDQIFCKAITK